MKKMNSMKKRLFTFVLAVIMVVGIVPIQAFASTDYNGGWAQAWVTQPVYSSADSSASRIGTIYATEGITVLWISGDVAYIEYSTSSGTKRGYLHSPNIHLNTYNNSVGRVTVNSTVYYGESTSTYQQAGTVYADEFVSILGEEDGWLYIEYNTSSGRKRGYIAESNVYMYYWGRHVAIPFNCKPYGLSNYWVTGNHTVYAGPSTQYCTVGSVSDGELVYYGSSYTDTAGRLFSYIEYYVNGTSIRKSGYIME